MALVGFSVFGASLAYFLADAPIIAGIFVVIGLCNAALVIEGGGVELGSTKYILSFLGVRWTLDDLCAHLVIIGRTRCGKTVSAFRTILIQLLRNLPRGFGALLIDDKGDLHHLVTRIFRARGKLDRLAVLRVEVPDVRATKEPALRTNLIGDRTIPWLTYAQLVIDVAVSQGQKTSNAFFKTQGKPTIAAIFETLEAAQLPVTLNLSYQFISNNRYFNEVLELLELTATDNARRLLDFWENFQSKGPDERSGIKSTTENYLQPYSEPAVAEVFSSTEPNFHFLDIDKGITIMPSIPQLYLFSRGYVYAFFKVLFIFNGLRRYDSLDQAAARDALPRFLIIDEAQNSLLASEEGLADYKATDRLGGARCILIYLMQSYSSAYPPIGDEHKVDTLFGNLASHIVFAIKDPRGREFASKMFGEFEKKKYSRTVNSNDTSRTESTEERPVYRPSFFLNMKRFEAVVSHVEGKTAHGKIPPLTDDGESIAPWYRWRLYRPKFKA